MRRGRGGGNDKGKTLHDGGKDALRAVRAQAAALNGCV
jgi:hypothetical protein